MRLLLIEDDAALRLTLARQLEADGYRVDQARDGVVDFTVPKATALFASYAAQAHIAHVIGTTGCGAEEDAAILAAARRGQERSPA